THHHHDHSGGNEDLVRLLGGNTPVYGGDDRIPALTHKVEDRAAFKLGTLDVTPLFTVCHTRGSVSFNVKTATESAVFTGDTLFIAGCGRFFEGTPQEMHTSLNEILGKLDNNTLVYCGHEYTQSNLRFAASIEPTNQDIKNKLEWAQNNPVTVPSSIGEEKKINPFMRVAEPSVQQVVGATDLLKLLESCVN
ncbi:Metallo-hydrolase/oxidoreductase, partial [Rhizoclosmatium globosum]